MMRIMAWFARGLVRFILLLRRRLTPAGQLLLAVALLAAALGVDTSRSMAYQLFALAAGLLLFGALAALLDRLRVDIAVHLPPVASAGVPMTVRYTLTNRGKRTIAGFTVRERVRPMILQPGATPDRAALANHVRAALRGPPDCTVRPATPAPLKAGAVASGMLEIVPRVRGRLRIDAWVAQRADPLGLVLAESVSAAQGETIVLPRRYRIPELALPGHRRQQAGGVSFANSIGDSEEFIGLRDYRAGDSLQKIHWKSFARTGKPVVKEYRDEYFERHALALDACIGGVDAGAFPAVFEEAVAIAASFAYAVDTRESLLDFLFVGDAVHVTTAGRGHVQPLDLLKAIACVQASARGSLGRFEQAILARRAELTSCILVLAGWDAEREAMVDRIARTGLPLRVIAVSPRVIERKASWLLTAQPGHVQQALAGLAA